MRETALSISKSHTNSILDDGDDHFYHDTHFTTHNELPVRPNQHQQQRQYTPASLERNATPTSTTTTDEQANVIATGNTVASRSNPNISSIAMPSKDVNDFRYHRLERENQYNELQFKQKEPPIPIKAISIALVMFLTGSIMIIIGALLFTGHISAKYSDRMWPLFIIGSLLFLPGFYHVRIAYYAWRKYEGFSFDDIPTDD